mmetsp:Transcript_84826/g.193456  ORF Transcript_84826/g.193456 Transcript_84826/m.193456 type:complete len:1093 (+) Transcript_84826:112-3390(+)|eukprot:CAMPEP_0204351198 /NCGR_PEP_ID=MMETSP0469-20131031/30917_1 /ASSEMBLY_ACC=CAM_ASM_000384 /TAXON_ID=2969 /ORGANISM="Oxyrrhis marina" /LENGTH=1092 /DNA_ID=CAMNT_0051337691 /DNA_START=78 /DNA_END=3356 /DNA_ORIENTATION=+
MEDEEEAATFFLTVRLPIAKWTHRITLESFDTFLTAKERVRDWCGAPLEAMTISWQKKVCKDHETFEDVGVPMGVMLNIDMPPNIMQDVNEYLEGLEKEERERLAGLGRDDDIQNGICFNPMSLRQFTIFTNTAIIGKCLTIGLIAHYDPVPTLIDFLDAVGQLTFLSEVGFRTGLTKKGIRKIYFRNFWTIADFTCIVLCGCLPWVLGPMGGDLAMTGNLFRCFQLLRVGHFVRQARQFRYHPLLRPLYSVVLGVVASLRIMWANLLIMAFSTYAFSCFAVMFFGRDAREHDDPLRDYWGTVFRAMWTACQMSFGDGGFDILRLTLDRYPMAWMYFTIFLIAHRLIFINVILASVVEAHFETSRQDEDRIRKLQERAVKSKLHVLANLFQATDASGDALLSIQEFDTLFDNPNAQDLLKQLAIHRKDVPEIFNLLDDDDAGTLSPSEFSDGVAKMQGTAAAKSLLIGHAKVVGSLSYMKAQLEETEYRLDETILGNFPDMEEEEGVHHHVIVSTDSDAFSRRLVWLLRFLVAPPSEDEVLASIQQQHADDEEDAVPVKRPDLRKRMDPFHKHKGAEEQQSVKKPEKYINLVYMVNTTSYEAAVCTLIFFNSLTIGVRANLNTEGGDTGAIAVFNLLDTLCIIAFLGEVVVQSFANGFWDHFVRNPVNLCDFILIVVCGAFASWVLEPLDVPIGSALRSLQVLRALRFVKPVSRLRYKPQFRPMWITLGGVSEVARIMGYNIFIMSVVVVSHATVASSTVGKAARDEFSEDMMFVYDKFGGVGASTYTMLQIMFLDGGFHIMRVTVRAFPVSLPFFLVYLYVGVMTTMNVVIATVLETIFELGRVDQLQREKNEEAAVKEKLGQLAETFAALDKDKEGSLSKREFSKIFENQQAATQLQRLSIDPSDLDSIYDILDQDGSGSIGLEEFLEGISRMAGPAKSKDLMIFEKMLASLGEQFFERLEHFDKLMENTAARIWIDEVLGRLVKELHVLVTGADRRQLSALLEQLEKVTAMASADPELIQFSETERRSTAEVLVCDESAKIQRNDLSPMATENVLLQQRVNQMSQQLRERQQEMESLTKQLEAAEAKQP